MALPTATLHSMVEWRGWRLEPLHGVRRGNAYVLFRDTDTRDIPGPPFPPELWVRPGYSGFRGAFGKFLVRYEGFASGKIPKSWHVDHLCNCALLHQKSGDFYVRLMLQHGPRNMAFGGGYERLLTAQDADRDSFSNTHVDYAVILKVRGERLPRVSGGPDEWSRWTNDIALKMARRGWGDFAHMYGGITTMLNLAFAGEWRALPESPQVQAYNAKRVEAYETAAKVYLLVSQVMEVPVPMGIYTSREAAQSAADATASGLRWKMRSWQESNAWDESVRPFVEYRVLAVRPDSNDIHELRNGVHVLNSLRSKNHPQRRRPERLPERPNPFADPPEDGSAGIKKDAG